MKEIPLPKVRRVPTEHGDHIEPPLDTTQPPGVKQLAWWAAVTAHDTGLTICLHEAAVIVGGRPVPGWYALTVGPVHHSPLPLADAWTYLNGVCAGAEAARAEVT